MLLVTFLYIINVLVLLFLVYLFVAAARSLYGKNSADNAHNPRRDQELAEMHTTVFKRRPHI